MPKVTIHLAGKLAKLAGTKTHVTFAETIRDAIDSLQEYDKLNPHKTSKKITVACKEATNFEQLDAEITVKELHLEPSNVLVGGGGMSNFLRIVIGIVLVVVGFLVSVYGSPELGTALMGAGIAMILGGIYSLLFPVEDPKASENIKSYGFNNVNTTESGTPIPIILGEFKYAGHMLSFNVDSKPRGSTAELPYLPNGWKKLN